MKRLNIIITLALTALSIASCSSNGFKLEGVAEGIEDGDTLLVLSDDPDPLDTLIVKDGKFEWSGEVDSVFICSIFDPQSMAMVNFFREPGTVKVLLSAVNNSEVSGTKSNDALQELNNLQHDFQARIEALNAQLSVDSVSDEMRQSVHTQYLAIQKEIENAFKELAVKHIDNELGYLLMTQLAYGESFSKEEITENIAKMPAEFQNRQAIKELLQMSENTFSTNVGEKIPDFHMQSPEGDDVSIMDLVKQNKLTVIDFWASWCMPCRESMPGLKQLLADNQEKGFGIVGISIDDDKDAWTSAIEELELTWPQISDLQAANSSVARSFGVRAIPFTVVLDQDGTVLAKELRDEVLTQFISEHLN